MANEKNEIYSISETPAAGEMEHLSEAVENHKRSQTQGEYDQPGVEIKLFLKDAQGGVHGGVIACTVFREMHLDVLWVEDRYRRHGYGSQLVLGAEKIGAAAGCITAQTWTFSFQGPEFYPTIGYEPIGIYDGYPFGVTEHVFMKKKEPGLADNSMDYSKGSIQPDEAGLFLTTHASEADEKILHEGLQRHVKNHVGDEDKTSTIKLVVKNADGELAGGLFAWTTLRNLIFETIWIEEKHRQKGLGRRLMVEMERIAIARGCIASQASTFSFQAPAFFERMGYSILGTSNGYPQGCKEFYLIKKYGEHSG
jgi:GNAT superfamily N-acetyltransferase